MHSGNAAAMPLVRNAATFSFCHASRSVRITTAILVSNCMMAPARTCNRSDSIYGGRGATCAFCPPLYLRSPPLRGLERLRGVDIEKCAVAFDRHFRHRFTMSGDQVTGADVAVERHQLVEEAARPQHRIAAPVIADGHRDQMAAIRRKGFDQTVDQMRI